MKRINAFTLIEVVVVTSISLILIAIAIPIYLTFKPDVQLNAATKDFITDLRYIQQLSITKQVDHCAKLFLLERKYQLLQCGQEVILLEKTFPNEISQVNSSIFSNNEIRFNPYGAVRESGTVTLTNIANKIKNISIKPSGFIKIED